VPAHTVLFHEHERGEKNGFQRNHHREEHERVFVEYRDAGYQAGVDESELSPLFMRDFGCGFPEDGIYCLEETFNRLLNILRKIAMEKFSQSVVFPLERKSLLKYYPKNVILQRMLL
jgi:hypothetical protein